MKSVKKSAPKKQIFLVETISTFRHRYLVEAECADYANDDVAMNDGTARERDWWQEKYLGETIVGTRPVTDAEILWLGEIDKNDGSSWLPYDRFVWKDPVSSETPSVQRRLPFD